MVKEALIRLKIRKAKGDFSTFMSREASQSDVTALLKIAAKKANAEQRRVISSHKSV